MKILVLVSVCASLLLLPAPLVAQASPPAAGGSDLADLIDDLLDRSDGTQDAPLVQKPGKKDLADTLGPMRVGYALWDTAEGRGGYNGAIAELALEMDAACPSPVYSTLDDFSGPSGRLTTLLTDIQSPIYDFLFDEEWAVFSLPPTSRNDFDEAFCTPEALDVNFFCVQNPIFARSQVPICSPLLNYTYDTFEVQIAGPGGLIDTKNPGRDLSGAINVGFANNPGFPAGQYDYDVDYPLVSKHAWDDQPFLLRSAFDAVTTGFFDAHTLGPNGPRSPQYLKIQDTWRILYTTEADPDPVLPDDYLHIPASIAHPEVAQDVFDAIQDRVDPNHTLPAPPFYPEGAIEYYVLGGEYYIKYYAGMNADGSSVEPPNRNCIDCSQITADCYLYCLANADYSDHSVCHFRKWLEEKYVTLSALAMAWGGWSAITIDCTGSGGSPPDDCAGIPTDFTNCSTIDPLLGGDPAAAEAGGADLQAIFDDWAEFQAEQRVESGAFQYRAAKQTLPDGNMYQLEIDAPGADRGALFSDGVALGSWYRTNAERSDIVTPMKKRALHGVSYGESINFPIFGMPRASLAVCEAVTGGSGVPYTYRPPCWDFEFSNRTLREFIALGVDSLGLAYWENATSWTLDQGSFEPNDGLLLFQPDSSLQVATRGIASTQSATGLFMLDDTGGFEAGDKVQVTGCVEPGCIGAGCITVALIEPCPDRCGFICPPGEVCFKECGEIIEIGMTPFFAADSGGTYVLSDFGVFVTGEKVEVTGCLDRACGPFDGCVSVALIEPCVDDCPLVCPVGQTCIQICGTLVNFQAPGGVVDPDGTLETPGSATVAPNIQPVLDTRGSLKDGAFAPLSELNPVPFPDDFVDAVPGSTVFTDVGTQPSTHKSGGSTQRNMAEVMSAEVADLRTRRAFMTPWRSPLLVHTGGAAVSRFSGSSPGNPPYLDPGLCDWTIDLLGRLQVQFAPFSLEEGFDDLWLTSCREALLSPFVPDLDADLVARYRDEAEDRGWNLLILTDLDTLDDVVSPQFTGGTMFVEPGVAKVRIYDSSAGGTGLTWAAAGYLDIALPPKSNAAQVSMVNMLFGDGTLGLDVLTDTTILPVRAVNAGTNTLAGGVDMTVMTDGINLMVSAAQTTLPTAPSPAIELVVDSSLVVGPVSAHSVEDGVIVFDELLSDATGTPPGVYHPKGTQQLQAGEQDPNISLNTDFSRGLGIAKDLDSTIRYIRADLDLSRIDITDLDTAIQAVDTKLTARASAGFDVRAGREAYEELRFVFENDPDRLEKLIAGLLRIEQMMFLDYASAPKQLTAVDLDGNGVEGATVQLEFPMQNHARRDTTLPTDSSGQTTLDPDPIDPTVDQSARVWDFANEVFGPVLPLGSGDPHILEIHVQHPAYQTQAVLTVDLTLP